MCILIHQPPGQIALTRSMSKQAWSQNPHGGGFAFINDQAGITVQKELKSEAEFWRKLQNAMKNSGEKSDFLIHMRIGTSGDRSLNNVHPFQVNADTVMGHNGIINKMPDDPKKSDTVLFVEQVLSDLPRDWLENPYLVAMVDQYIGYSKLMFLTTDPALKERVYIIGKDKGAEERDCWYSNRNGIDELKTVVTLGKYSGLPSENIKVVQQGGKKREAGKFQPGNTASNESSLTANREDGWAWDKNLTMWIHDNGTISSYPYKINFVKGSGRAALSTRKVQQEWSLNRKEAGLDRETLRWETDMNNYLCTVCETAVDRSGICWCWVFFCLTCDHLLPICSCKAFPTDMMYVGPKLSNKLMKDVMTCHYEGTTKIQEDEWADEDRTESAVENLVDDLFLTNQWTLAEKWFEMVNWSPATVEGEVLPDNIIKGRSVM